MALQNLIGDLKVHSTMVAHTTLPLRNQTLDLGASGCICPTLLCYPLLSTRSPTVSHTSHTPSIPCCTIVTVYLSSLNFNRHRDGRTCACFTNLDSCLSSAAQSAPRRATPSASSRNMYKTTNRYKETAWSGEGQADCRRACAVSRWAVDRMV